MKTVRRHELKESDLAQVLETGRQYLKDHGGRIGLLVLVAVVAIALVTLSRRSRAADIEDKWRVRDALSFSDLETGKESLEELAAITNDATDESFVLASMLDQGLQAIRLARKGDDPPNDELNEIARQAFRRLLERFPDNPLVVGIAYCGLATVEENSFVLDGDPSHKERSREHLRAILDNPALALMPFTRMALERLDTLDVTFSAVTFEPPLELPGEADGVTIIPLPPSGPAKRVQLRTTPTTPKGEEGVDSDQQDAAGEPESPEEPGADQTGTDQPEADQGETDQPETDDPDPQQGTPKADEPG